MNAQNKHGNTPLHVACSEDYTEIVDLLLLTDKIVVNIKIANENGHTDMVNGWYCILTSSGTIIVK